MLACKLGDKATADLLIDAGISLAEKNIMGETAVNVCMKNGNKDLGLYLLSNKSAPIEKTKRTISGRSVEVDKV